MPVNVTVEQRNSIVCAKLLAYTKRWIDARLGLQWKWSRNTLRIYENI